MLIKYMIYQTCLMPLWPKFFSTVSACIIVFACCDSAGYNNAGYQYNCSDYDNYQCRTHILNLQRRKIQIYRIYYTTLPIYTQPSPLTVFRLLCTPVFSPDSATFHGGLPFFLLWRRRMSAFGIFAKTRRRGGWDVVELFEAGSKHPADVPSKEGTRVLLDNKLSRGTPCTFLKKCLRTF